MTKIIKSNLLYSGKFLEFYLDTAKREDGTILNWERCSRKNKVKAVMIVPYHIETKSLIMIAEYRIPIKKFEIGFPAGLCDKKNESIETVIKREIKEETGCNLKQILKISPFGYTSSGMTDEELAVAYVEVTGELSSKDLEKSEEIFMFSADKILIEKMLNDPTVNWGIKAWLICDNYIHKNIFNN